MKTYYDDGTIRIRSMMESDAKIIYDTYLSYDWHALNAENEAGRKKF